MGAAWAAAGCSLGAPVAAPPVVPTFPRTTTTAPSTAPARQPGLPTTCQDLIDGKRLDTTLGLPLSVVVRTVLGQPSPVVGLTGRITCSYGIPSPTGGYALQVSATSYRDEAAAAARVPVPIAVGQTTGMYLALPDGPVLLASAGTYSVTLTLGPTSFSPEQAPARAAAVAELVLSQVRA